MRLPSRTTLEPQAAPFSTTEPFSFNTSSTNQGVFSPVPPPNSSSFVNTVRRRPAKAKFPASSTALSRPAGPWQKGAMTLPAWLASISSLPRSASSNRSAMGPWPPGITIASYPARSTSASTSGAESSASMSARYRRKPSARSWPPADSAARLTSSTVGLAPPGVASWTVWPAPRRVWCETTSSSAQSPGGCLLPSRMVRESAADTTIRMLAMLCSCSAGSRAGEGVVMGWGLACGFELREGGVIEDDAAGGKVLFEVLDRAGAGDRHHGGGAAKQPGEGHLRGGGAQPGGGLVERAAGPGEFAGRDRSPGDEADAVLLGVVQDIFRAAVRQVVAVLHGGNGEVAPGLLEFGHTDLGQAQRLDLAFLLQVAEHAELLFRIDLGINPVQLQQVQRVHLELAQAQFGLLAEVLGTAHRHPFIRTGAGEPDLGGDLQAVPVRVQGLREDLLADVGPVGIGGVDEVDAELDGAADDGDGRLAVRRLAPDPVADNAHGAEAQPVHSPQVLQIDRCG